MDINLLTILRYIVFIIGIGILLIISLLALLYVFKVIKVEHTTARFRIGIGLGLVFSVIFWIAT